MEALLYGAYGYTGRLIAQEALDRGHRVVLAGRDPSALGKMGDTFNLETRTVSLNEPKRLRAVLEDMSIVLHCAGPFVNTAPPMVRACLETRTHYLDLTGEVNVFRQIAERDEEARSAGVMLLPGMGFDVVASDCAGRYVAEEAPSASLLEIALFAEGRPSRGTLKTLIGHLGRDGLVRRGGQLRAVPPGWTTRTVDFGRRRRQVMSVPEGSVVTAGFSTDIPNVTAYLALPRLVRQLVRGSRHVRGLLQWPPLLKGLKRLIDLVPEGPSVEERRRGQTAVWASARKGGEAPVTVRLEGPNAYTFTARVAVSALERIRDEGASPGYQTPSTAFGADFVLNRTGMDRSRVDGNRSQ